MVLEAIRQMTVEEYFAYDEAIEYKSEYIDGFVYPMMSGTMNHSAILVNAACALGMRLRRLEGRGWDCRPLLGSMRIGVSPTCFLYPDFSVYCGTAETDEREINLLNPILLGEVTSPITIEYDTGDKRRYYQSIPSLQHYLVIDQHRVRVDLYSRGADGSWRSRQFADIAASLPLAALGCALPLAEIYHRIEF